MRPGQRQTDAWRRISLGLTALAIAVAIAAPGLISSAFAQERRSWSLRDMLFPRKARQQEQFPSEVAPDPTPKARTKVPRPNKRQVKRAAPAEPATVVAPKDPSAKAVLVVGDFIAAGLAEGLNNVYANEPKVRIADRTNGASGFVREDHFDWPGKIGEIISAEKPAVVMVMIGANDRQSMKVGDRRETLRSEAWTREFTARVASFASAAADARVPLVWVGTIPFKSSKATSDMLALNEIYRRVSADVGAEFIDVWEGFVDEKGAFVQTGPDIAGQPVRLRSGDGINLTSAGKRKLAFYTERSLKRLLGVGEPGGMLPPGGQPTGIEPGSLAPIDRTVPMALNDPALDGGAELLGASVAGAEASRSADRGRSPTGLSVEPVIGRADDFSWPRRATTSTTAAKSYPRL